MNWNQIDIGLIKDVVLIIGSLTATIFTIWGFGKWKKEHKGKVKYELSRKLLKSIYDLRDEFKSVRSPMIWASEFPENKIRQISRSEEYHFIFKNRMKYLQNSLNEFRSLLPEAEIDFDEKFNTLCNELIGHIRNYHWQLNEFIQLSDNLDLISNPHHKKLNSVVFNNDAKNETTEKFDDTVDQLKKCLIREMKSF